MHSRQRSPLPRSLAEYTWLASIILLPVACAPWIVHPLELPKSLLLLTLAAILLGVLIVDRVLPGNRAPDLDAPIAWLLLLSAMVLTAATLLSGTFAESVSGTLLRRQGLLTLLAMHVLLLGTSIYLSSLDQIHRLLKAAVATGSLLCLYGFLQAGGIEPLPWVSDGNSMVMATLGRSNFLGSYLTMLIPLTLTLCIISKHRLVYGLLLVSQLACLVLTQARSSQLGLLAAGVVWGIAFHIRPGRRCRGPAFAIATLFGLSLLGLTALCLPASLSPVPAFSAMLLDGGGSFAARLTIWRRTADLLATRPWLGFGPDAMEPVFSRSFPPELIYYQGRNVMVDRAHNLWLDLGMNCGILGITIFACLLLLIGYRLFRTLQATDDPSLRWPLLGLCAALAGHVADLQFTFDLTATGALFWLFLGAAAALTRLPSQDFESDQPASSGLHMQALLLVVLLLGLLFALIAHKPLRADSLYFKAQQATADLVDRLASMEQAIRLKPDQPEYRLYLATLYGQAGSVQEGLRQIKEARHLRPGDPWLLIARGNLWMEANPVVPMTNLDQAEDAYRGAIALAPDIASFHTGLAAILIRQGRFFQALNALEEALRLDATDSVAYAHLAEVHTILGNPAKAEKARRQAVLWSTRQRRDRPQ